MSKKQRYNGESFLLGVFVNGVANAPQPAPRLTGLYPQFKTLLGDPESVELIILYYILKTQQLE